MSEYVQAKMLTVTLNVTTVLWEKLWGFERQPS